jgi:YbgC/YbaW family acyl-CoA thioester hydrolase
MPHATIQLRVPFPDVDSSGRIHFTAMLRYFEMAEHELMRSIGYPYARAMDDIGFPRVHVECDFHSAVLYDDQLSVEATVERVGSSSWTVAFTARVLPQDENPLITSSENEAIAARGKMVIVTMDPQTQKARALPEELRIALAG